MSKPSSDVEIALSNCASEPIHIPGRIQSFGGLIGVDLKTQQVRYASANMESITGRDGWLGSDFKSFFAADERTLYHDIRGAMGLPTIDRQRERLGCHQIGDRTLDVAMHHSGSTLVVEFEPHRESTSRPDTAISQVRRMLATLTASDGDKTLLHSATDVLRRITGFDRVMGYEFLEGGDGEVRAESLRPGLDPYLGLRYPSADIPPQVREAMLKMPFRCNADIESESVDLLSLDDASPLDLTLSHLRGISPIHVEYLRNMGVRSTVNLAIPIRGELWGLFALHHYRPMLMSPQTRGICELFSHFFSLQMQQELESYTISLRRRAASILSSIRRESETESAVDESIGNARAERQTLVDRMQSLGNDLCELLEADGMTFIDGDSRCDYGVTPSTEVVHRVIDSMNDDLMTFSSTTALNEVGSLASDDHQTIAGGLFLKVDESYGTYLAFFRRPLTDRIRWAGNPDKRIVFGPNGPRLHPRASFDAYVDSVRGSSKNWSLPQTTMASEIRGSIMDVLLKRLNASGARHQRQQEHQDLLISELNHRVKNVLSLVRSILRQTRSKSQSVSQYMDSFEGRIMALAKAHDLIGGNAMRWASLASILKTELGPYADSQTEIDLDGPGIAIRSEVAPVFAMVIHELVTNAAKYGALRDDGESLSVKWRESHGGVEMLWTENFAATHPAAAMDGFGTSMIRNAFPHECGGESSIDLTADGLRARLWIPGRHVQIIDEEEPSMAITKVPSRDEADRHQLFQLESVLVVEDNFVIAKDYERMLQKLGAKSVQCFGNPTDALRAIEQTDFDLAILDIDLGGDNSLTVADELTRLDKPFAFVSGFGNAGKLSQKLANRPLLEKPLTVATLADALANKLQVPRR